MLLQQFTMYNVVALVLFLGPVSEIQAQADSTITSDSPQIKPIKFDVVSVKQDKTDDSFPGPMVHPDGFYARNVTLLWVLFYVFDLESNRSEDQFSGLPGWAKSERYDIIAKVAFTDVDAWNRLPELQRRSMIRDVLADRFRLQIHVESRDRQVYALVVAKGGPKMQSVTSSADTASPYGPAGYIAQARVGSIGKHATMKVLAHYLSGLNLGREVLDETGLTGNYDFTLSFTPLQAAGGDTSQLATSGNVDAPFLFTALQEQLGLKLEARKGSVDLFVVDHIERPSEN